VVLVMWLLLSKEECDAIVSILAITNSTHHVHSGISLIYIYIYIEFLGILSSTSVVVGFIYWPSGIITS